MGEDFNPRSTDAMFAEILANMKRDSEEREAFRAEMKETLRLHSEQIGSLQAFSTALKAKVAVISGGIGVAGSVAAEWLKSHLMGGGGNSGHN